VRSYTRQQLKQDKVATAVTEKVSWPVEHRDKLVWVAVAVVAAVVILAGGWFYLNQRDQAASADIGKALAILQAPIQPANAPVQPGFVTFPSAKERAQAAQKEFKAIEQKYPHTRASEFARYFVGVTSLDMGDTAGAEKTLKELAGARDKELGSLAKFALASVYRAENRQADAIKVYQALIANPTTTVPKNTAQLELAALYQDKQPAEAERIYQEIQKENPKSAAADVAASRLSSLKPSP